jgi:hypothetical protein
VVDQVGLERAQKLCIDALCQQLPRRDIEASMLSDVILPPVVPDTGYAQDNA